MHGGLQLGPPGRWWDDSQFAKSLGLTVQQQQEMDAVFRRNRAEILARYQAYQKEEIQLAALIRAKSLDESALMAQTARLGQSRIELEQANTHTLLQIRALMSIEQIDRLETHR